MALKITKRVKLDDGTEIEITGTEEEVAAFERKQKKNETTETKKKGIIYGKELDEWDEIKEFIRREADKIRREVTQPVVVPMPYPVYPWQQQPLYPQQPWVPQWPTGPIWISPPTFTSDGTDVKITTTGQSQIVGSTVQ